VVLLLVVLTFYRGRLFCNTLCPVGTILGWVSRISIYKIRFDKQKCISCKKCERACKAGCIDVKNMKVDFDRCVACYNCIDSCNDLAIGYSRMKAKKTIEKPVDEGRRDLFKTMAIGAASLTFLSAKNVDQVTSSFTTKITAKSKLPVTPPGSVSLDHFKSTCTACHLCISACPTNVLQSSIAEYGIAGLFLPKMDYHVNYCNIDCTRCSNVCPTGAIIPLTKEQKAITQIGRVNFVHDNCVVVNNGDDCGACAEHCPTAAVFMVPYQNNLFIPEVNPDACIGCGACEHVCPSRPFRAIFVESSPIHGLAIKPKNDGDKQKEEVSDEFPF
jgi:ferredoxin